MNHDPLRRMDIAFMSDGSDETLLPLVPVEPVARCRTCLEPLEPSPTSLLEWCSVCRAAYLRDTGRLFCEVPAGWRPLRFLRYWGEGINGSMENWNARAFARHLCERIGMPYPAAVSRVERMKPDAIRIGRLAIAHQLLSRVDAAWILRFQRSSPAHRRRCFGEIAVSLGLWSRDQLARLLAAQVERRRGLAAAIAEANSVHPYELIDAEREFFGLSAIGSTRDEQCPFEEMMTK